MASDTDFTVATQFYSHNMTVAVALYKIRGTILNLLTSWELNCKIVLTSTKTIRADLILGMLATSQFRVFPFAI